MKVLEVELPKTFHRELSYDYPVIGVDSESLTTGYAFLVADSSGRHTWIKSFDDVLKFFDCDVYEHCLLVAFNADFDVSVMLKWMGKELCTELVNEGVVSTGGFTIHYVPSKYLQFRFGNRFIRLFDVQQYFQGSLDYNAKQYLGTSKSSIGTKTFTEKYYGDQEVLTYCAHDAVLAQGLGEYVVQAFSKIGVGVASLASPANIIESYALDRLGIRNRVARTQQGALEFAIRAFDGAWFENFKAGTFEKTYRYDLVSAYPGVIRNLLDSTLGYWTQGIKRPKDAVYGREFATVTVPKSYISPLIFRNARDEDLRPHGTWTRYFPSQVLDWARSHKCKVDTRDAWWFIPYEKVYKYRSVVDKFFEIKRANAADSMEHWSAKIGLAGIYGKFLQHRDNRGGRLYNPIYAGEITADVQLMVADACLDNPEAIIAVMSDCINAIAPLKLDVGKGIGQWKMSGPDASLWIGPAQYETEGKDERFRKIPWKNLLEKKPSNAVYEVLRNGPLSLLQGIKLNRFEDIGVFRDVSVKFDIRKLNWRRFWPARPKSGADLLNKQYDSIQLHVSSRLREEDLKLWEL